jgi:exodeoxyribonuclease VII large subunit
MFRGRNQHVDFATRRRLSRCARWCRCTRRAANCSSASKPCVARARNLYEAFLRLKEKLAQAGLFDTERKRPIPDHPRVIGVVTSLQAAAMRDVLTTLQRRAPHVPVIVYPVPVQGQAPRKNRRDARRGQRGASATC